MNNIKIGPGFIGTLTLILIIAKIWGPLEWSWLWILAPTWISAILLLLLMILIIIISMWGHK